MNNFKLALAGAVALIIVGCGSPVQEYQALIESNDFIPFAMPLESTRTGTIVRGNNNAIYIVAKPERCFPDLPGDQNFRWVNKTDLPDEAHSVSFDFSADVGAIMVAGNPLVTFKSDVKFVKSVQVTFEGASIEFLDEMALQNYYTSAMSAQCKNALTQYPFILQALRVEGMDFVFKDDAGATININVGNIGKIVNIGVGVNWSITNDYELKITSPKFIGYRLGRLDNTGKVILDSTKIDKNGNWIFEKAADMLSLKMIGHSQLAEPLATLP